MVTRTVWSIRRVQSDFQHILVVRAETFRLAVALIYPRKSARIFRYCYSYISYHETQNLTRWVSDLPSGRYDESLFYEYRLCLRLNHLDTGYSPQKKTRCLVWAHWASTKTSYHNSSSGNWVSTTRISRPFRGIEEKHKTSAHGVGKQIPWHDFWDFTNPSRSSQNICCKLPKPDQ